VVKKDIILKIAKIKEVVMQLKEWKNLRELKNV